MLSKRRRMRALRRSWRFLATRLLNPLAPTGRARRLLKVYFLMRIMGLREQLSELYATEILQGRAVLSSRPGGILYVKDKNTSPFPTLTAHVSGCTNQRPWPSYCEPLKPTSVTYSYRISPPIGWAI